MREPLSDAQLRQWESDGFVVLPGFAAAGTLRAMRERALELVRSEAAGGSIGDAYVVPEKALAHAKRAEDRVSKVFRVHRDEPVFREFATDPGLLDRVGSLLGERLSCFLSQFIFKLPGALGQPWHQDAFYFPFDRGPQVGAWLAITRATEHNGPLWVLPGSHREPVHATVRDPRPDAGPAYVEIVDHDMSDAIPVLLDPGDLLLFHGHLMHKSTDNRADYERAAMVYHFGDADTVDQSVEKWGFAPPNVDWMRVR